jgi:hypothetical protein
MAGLGLGREDLGEVLGIVAPSRDAVFVRCLRAFGRDGDGAEHGASEFSEGPDAHVPRHEERRPYSAWADRSVPR